MIVRIAAVLAVVGVAAAAVAAPTIPNPADLTSKKIRTLTMDTHVDREIRPILKTLPGDFAEAYRFHAVEFSYVQPWKLHFESVVMNVHIAYTINGNSKYTSVPTYHVHKVEDVTGAPGKRQSLMDVGLLAPEILTDFNLKYLRTDHNGDYVFEVHSKVPSERAKSIIWIDPKTHIVSRREQYNQDGVFESYYLYSRPVEPRPHIYVPTHVEVYNAKGQLAAVSSYSNIKINLPVDESIFEF